MTVLNRNDSHNGTKARARAIFFHSPLLYFLVDNDSQADVEESFDG